MDDGVEQVSWLAGSLQRHLPKSCDSVAIDTGNTAYSCGGSPGFSPKFPFQSRSLNVLGPMRRGELNARRRMLSKSSGVNGQVERQLRELLRCPQGIAGVATEAAPIPGAEIAENEQRR